jgi:hypothetical protein
MQKDKFDRQVTLLRKYYSGTLEKREKQEFREMLNDRNLENVFRQLSQGDILAEKLEEYKQYDARKAFGKFSRQQKEDYPDSYCSSGGFTFRNELVTESWITGGRSCSTGTAGDDSPRELQSYITTDKWRDGESRAGFHAGTGKKWDSD